MNIAEFSKVKPFYVLGLLLCVNPLVGCGQVDDRPERYPASGTVMQGGQPVAGAAVSFVPKSSSGTSAFATTDDTGKFQLTTFDPGDGAIPGEYHVKVEKYDTAEEAVPAADSSEGTSELDDSAYNPEEEDEQAAAGKSLLPAKYADPYNSGIEFTVTASETENNFPINLD